MSGLNKHCRIEQIFVDVYDDGTIKSTNQDGMVITKLTGSWVKLHLAWALTDRDIRREFLMNEYGETYSAPITFNYIITSNGIERLRYVLDYFKIKQITKYIKRK